MIDSAFFIRLLILLAITIISLSFHEMGHFIAAKIFRVNIIEFSIGIGPILFYFYHRNIKYSFRIFLIGAFVLLDSKQLRDHGREVLTEYNVKDLNQEKLSWSRLKHFNWIHKWGNYKIVNFKEYIDISNYLKYTRLLNPIMKNKILFNDAKYVSKIIITLAGILFNFILFATFFGISQINPSLSGGFKIEDVGHFFLEISKSLIFIQSSLNIAALSNGNLLQFFIVTMVLLNIVIAFFNALPLPLLDMFKVVSITYEKYTNKTLTQKANNIYAIIGIIFIMYTSVVPVITLLIYKN